MDLTLIDQTLLVVVKKLDWVFDRDHMLVALVVDLVEHGGERGGLARTCRTGDEHQAARLVAQPSHDCGESESVERLDFPWDRPEDGCNGAALMKDIAAEASQALQAEGEVELKVFLQPVLLDVGENAVGERLGISSGQGRHVERAQLTVHADARWTVG